MDSRNWFVFLRFAASIAATVIATAALAQGGGYDPDFGSVGRTWIDVTASLNDAGSRLIRLPSGNFFMSGACGGVACAAWLTPQGQKASGFGTAGTGTALFSDFSGWPNDGY